LVSRKDKVQSKRYEKGLFAAYCINKFLAGFGYLAINTDIEVALKE
jgi:hypothetical protein